MLEQIMNSANLNNLSRGLEAASLRQKVLANNIANVNTPNFKRSEVVFETLLAKELYGDNDGCMDMVRTHDKHLPMAPTGGARASVVQDNTTTMRTDNNNVDIDVEMANLAKNQIYYNALAQSAGGYFTKMKNIITSK